jgi:hypothetical protein
MPNSDEEAMATLEVICHRLYWYRLWIVQELSLAFDIVVMIGVQ